MKSLSTLGIIFVLNFTSSCQSNKGITENAKVVRAMGKTIASSYSEVPQLSIADYQKWRDEKKDHILVDVRTKEEREVSMIPGAISTGDFELIRQNAKISRVVAYCTVGKRSSDYAKSLRKSGIDAYNLQESILGWAHAQGPLENAKGNTKKVHVYSKTWDLLPQNYEGVYAK